MRCQAFRSWRLTKTWRCAEEIIRSLEDYLVSTDGKTLAEVVGEILAQRRLTLSVAESCTAGYLAGAITDLSGASRYFLGGVVAYSNDAKRELLGVSPDILEQKGAVSGETAEEMARGVCGRFNSDYAISVTGIAGPEGGTPRKPLGTVYICVLRNTGEPVVSENKFSGDRAIVRHRSVLHALYMLYVLLKAES